MGPAGAAPHRTLTPRPAQLVIGAVLGGVVILLVVMLVKNALVLRTISRINDHGGMVIGYSDPFPFWSWWPARVRGWVRDWYVVRDGYFVSFDLDAAPCSVGETLRMFPERAVVAGDAALADVQELGRVERLVLHKTTVTDAGLGALRGLRGLTFLSLEGTRVTGPGLAHLRGLPLHTLSLARTPVDDAGLAHLDDLPAVASLDLQGTRVTGPGLAHLARFGGLEHLYLDDTPIDDRALRFLAGLHVTGLFLSGTALSDAGLADLARMPHLQRVTLCRTQVTNDAAVRSRFQTRGACLDAPPSAPSTAPGR